MDALLVPVKKAIEDFISYGQLQKVDIGWFRIDISKYTNLKEDFPFASSTPDIIIYHYHTHLKYNSRDILEG